MKTIKNTNNTKNTNSLGDFSRSPQQQLHWKVAKTIGNTNSSNKNQQQPLRIPIFLEKVVKTLKIPIILIILILGETLHGVPSSKSIGKQQKPLRIPICLTKTNKNHPEYQYVNIKNTNSLGDFSRSHQQQIHWKVAKTIRNINISNKNQQQPLRILIFLEQVVKTMENINNTNNTNSWGDSSRGPRQQIH